MSHESKQDYPVTSGLMENPVIERQTGQESLCLKRYRDRTRSKKSGNYIREHPEYEQFLQIFTYPEGMTREQSCNKYIGILKYLLENGRSTHSQIAKGIRMNGPFQKRTDMRQDMESLKEWFLVDSNKYKDRRNNYYLTGAGLDFVERLPAY